MIFAFLAETAGHADAGAAFPPFETWHMPSQLFWLAILFMALYVALSRYILPKLSDTIEKRANRIAFGLDEAARLNNQAVDARKALELRLAEARSKARETAEKARVKSEAELASETARVDADVSKKLEAAETRIKRLRSDAMKNVEAIAVDAAEAMIGKFGVKASKAELGKAVAKALE
jgi:F-type H+-transporting ATPase subunit b